MTIRSAARVLGVAFLVLLVGSGCDDAFDPFQSDGDLRFSLFGYLNAAADTQWIRVTPIRQSVFTAPGPLDVTVTLEDTATGATTELNDSIFRYQSAADLEDVSESWVHNYWTDAPIEFGVTYRVSVETAQGETTTATVTVPDEILEAVIETRLVRTGSRFGTAEQHLLRVRAEHIAMVRVIHHVADRIPGGLPGTFTDCPFDPETPRVYSIKQIGGQTTINGDTVEMEISATLHPGILETSAGPSCVVGRREVQIVSSGSDWSTGVQYSPSAPAVGGVPSEVEGGVGFVGGVVTLTVPFEDCSVRPPALGASCEMRYNDQSASLEGVVLDSRCGWPVEGATIELSEVGDAPTVVRTTATDQFGRYRIGALVGGPRYAVLISQPMRWPPDDPYDDQRVYAELRDTLTVQAGTTEDRDFALPRQVPCQLLP